MKSSNNIWAIRELEQVADAAATLNNTFNRLAKKIRKLNDKIGYVKETLGETGIIAGTQKAAFTRAMKKVNQSADDVESINIGSMSDVVLDLVRTFNPEYVPDSNDLGAVNELSETDINPVAEDIGMIVEQTLSPLVPPLLMSKTALRTRREQYRQRKNHEAGYPVLKSIRRSVRSDYEIAADIARDQIASVIDGVLDDLGSLNNLSSKISDRAFTQDMATVREILRRWV